MTIAEMIQTFHLTPVIRDGKEGFGVGRKITPAERELLVLHKEEIKSEFRRRLAVQYDGEVRIKNAAAAKLRAYRESEKILPRSW